MTFKKVVPWESDGQEQAIRRWQDSLTFLQRHGLVDFHGPLHGGLTTQQRDFLWSLDRLGNSPTDADLLHYLTELIHAAPPWLCELERWIAAAREKVMVVTADELLQYTDERLQEIIRAGKTLFFEDAGWGVQFAITWDEQAQACYDRARQVQSAGIAGMLINWLAKRIEIIDP